MQKRYVEQLTSLGLATLFAGIQRLSHDCCAAAAALHAEGVVMRDFRLPNVLTRHGVGGDYVVVDMEYAGPDCTEWSLGLLDKWDASTLIQVNYMTPCLW